mgnify:CR=1 FL=1
MKKNKEVRDYNHCYHVNSAKRLAKCGHWDASGRYYKCIKCAPELGEDPNEAALYAGSELDEEETEEEYV